MRNEMSYGNGIFTIIKATLFALAVSLLAAVGFAVLLRVCSVGEGWIYTINQVVKVVCIALSVFLFVQGEKGWLKGGATGLLFTGFSYLAFSALGGDFSLSWLILVELLIAFLGGAISGILTVNLKK
ncbi:MAG: TIGR04086 family membrane protein [Clostridia bacterium]|nr:TIGR04086 family membrane protein [Clostridia bacterium]